MKFPSPAAIIGPDFTEFSREVRTETAPDGSGLLVIWGEENDHPHTAVVGSLEEDGQALSGPILGSRTDVLTIRPLDPYDGLVLSEARVPHPLAVLNAQVLYGGNMTANELAAVVAADNSVVTLLLETGLGTYVRFLGEWQLLTPDSESLDNCEFLTVSPGALTIFDKADAANVSLTSSDLPRVVDGQNILPDDLLPEAPLETMKAAAGSQIPLIASAGDIPAAIDVARLYPEMRWYVARRAKALGSGHLIPAGW